MPNNCFLLLNSKKTFTGHTLLSEIVSDINCQHLYDSKSLKEILDNECLWWSKERNHNFEKDILNDIDGIEVWHSVTKILKGRIMSETWGYAFEEDNDESSPVTESVDICTIIRIVQLNSAIKVDNLSIISRDICSMIEKDRNALSLELLVCVSAGLSKVCQRWELSSIKSNTTCLWLMRLVMHLYISILIPLLCSNPILMPPVWKCICDIALSLFITDNLDFPTLQNSLQPLLFFIGDEEKKIRNLFAIYITHCDENKSCGNCLKLISRHIKVITFLVYRFLILLPMMINAKQKNRSKSGIYLKHALLILCLIRGLPFSVNILLEQKGSKAKLDNSKSMLKKFLKLGSNVELCLLKEIFRVYDKINFNMELPFIKSFNSLEVNNEIKSDSDLDFKSFDISNQLIHFSISNAKLKIFLSVLKRLICFSVNPRIDLQLRNNFMEISLTICEDLLFSTIPMCQSWLVSQTSSWNKGLLNSSNLIMLTEVINIVVDCTLVCERYQVFHCKQNLSIVRIHFMLVRWLYHGLERPEKSCSLTQEVLLAVVHAHIVRSIHSTVDSFRNNNTTPAASCCSLLAKLVFDERTSVNLRNGISVLLHRLLHCSYLGEKIDSPISLQIVVLITFQSLIKECYRERVIQREKKCRICASKKQLGDEVNTRSTLSYTIFWPINDLMSISPLMEVLSSQDVFWSKMDYKTQDFIRNIATDFIHNQDFTEKYHDYIEHTPTFHLLVKKYPLSPILALTFVIGALSVNNKFGLEVLKNILPAKGRICTSQTRDYITKYFDSFYFEEGLNSTFLRFLHLSFGKISENISSIYLHRLNNIFCQIHNYTNDKRLTNTCILNTSPLLSVAGLFLCSDKSPTLLTSVCSIFSLSLASKKWPIVVVFMSSMIYFASNLPVHYRKILPTCIPCNVQSLLQFRLKGTFYSFSSPQSDVIEQITLRWLEYMRVIDMEDITGTVRLRKIYSRSLSDMHIVPGSKIVMFQKIQDTSFITYSLLVLPPRSDWRMERDFINLGAEKGLVGIIFREKMQAHDVEIVSIKDTSPKRESK